MLLIKLKLCIISIDSSLNIFLSLLTHLSEIIERTNFLSKMYDILGFLNFLYSLHLIQWIYFTILFLEPIHKKISLQLWKIF